MIPIDLIDFFFFSSRRRHTRLTCDWSSDVCSSDLARKNIKDYGQLICRSSSLSKRTRKLKFLRVPTFADRKSTRLNSSHMSISYAVFCLKKKSTIISCTRLNSQALRTRSSLLLHSV